MYDRLRARAPPTDADAWTAGTVQAVRRAEGGYVVTVRPDPGDGSSAGDPVEVTLSAALFDLFARRLDRAVDAPGDAVGARAWYR